MIIDYKNELLHQHSAISAVSFAHKQFIENITADVDKDETEEVDGNQPVEKSYFAPLGAILSCIAGSHKLDHIRLCCDPDSKQSKIVRIYSDIFDENEEARKSVAKYQSANQKEAIDNLKPYQIINSFMSGETLNIKQITKAKEWVEGIETAFKLTKSALSLKKGQRLYKGVSFNPEQLNDYISALENGTTVNVNHFYSTSLSESIALAFSVLSDSKRLESVTKHEGKDDPYLPVVLELTNRIAELPFIMPDAIRMPERSQGQMEILLQAGIKLQPTHIDTEGSYVKIYADILI